MRRDERPPRSGSATPKPRGTRSFSCTEVLGPGTTSRGTSPNSLIATGWSRLIVGAGRTADNDGPLSQDEMARDTIALIETLDPPVRVVGYSDGAVVALLVALARPDLVERLALISGVFRPEGWVIKPDSDSTDEFPAEMVERYGQLSPDGVDHFRASRGSWPRSPPRILASPTISSPG